MQKIDSHMLQTIADLHDVPQGAYNIRKNGESAGRSSTENIIIENKKDKPGIDITVKANTKNESVHIPVIITESGLSDVVYNDFYIGKNAKVKYVERHYGEGDGNAQLFLYQRFGFGAVVAENRH